MFCSISLLTLIFIYTCLLNFPFSFNSSYLKLFYLSLFLTFGFIFSPHQYYIHSFLFLLFPFLLVLFTGDFSSGIFLSSSIPSRSFIPFLYNFLLLPLIQSLEMEEILLSVRFELSPEVPPGTHSPTNSPWLGGNGWSGSEKFRAICRNSFDDECELHGNGTEVKAAVSLSRTLRLFAPERIICQPPTLF